MTQPLTPEELGAILEALDLKPTGKLSELAKIAGLSLAKDYIGVDLSGEDLSKDNLSGINLSNANLINTNLNFTNLCYANLSGADLSDANLSRANLSRANLSRTNLSRANLDVANLGVANLSGANLKGTNLRGTNLGHANLSGANLSGAYLGGVYLGGANLSGAYLGGAYLGGADLSDANLSDADLRDADLSDAAIGKETRLSYKRSLVEKFQVFSRFNRLPKPLMFGLFAALGCLTGAILGERFLNVTALLPPPPSHAVSLLMDNSSVQKLSLTDSLLSVGGWTAILALGTWLILIVGQNYYLHRRLLTIREGAFGSIGSLVVGLASGAAGQLFYATVPSLLALEILGRILAWTILGALLGGGMALLLPNLKLNRALLGGGLGGIVGVLGFWLVASVLGNIAGRLLGAAILGFSIGLTIVVVEVLTRKAWLVIHWGSRDESTIALGTQPVVLGSSNKAQIYLQDLAPVMGTICLKGGKIEYKEQNTGQKLTLGNGTKLQITGSVWIEVKKN